MPTPTLGLTTLAPGPAAGARLLVVGPSLGTSVSALWSAVAQRLGATFTVVGWDLPGHGSSAPATGFDVIDLAAGVRAAVDQAFGPETRFSYAGDSLGGAVGLQLLIDSPERVSFATLACTGPRIGDPESWRIRASAVRHGGTGVLLDSAPGRWFGPGFADREPLAAAALIGDLARCDAESYAVACEALAIFDVRARLAEIATPVLAIAGAADAVTPTSLLRHIAAGVQFGKVAVLEGVAHLAPAEAPDQVAGLITYHAGLADPVPHTDAQTRAEGMRVRREVLSDPYVDRALGGATDLTGEFQDFITRHAWGGIWTRPGLDRRSRSMITLTALVARGHQEELALHLRAARTNGLSNAEIAEVLLQAAIYCGVPDANTAFRIAAQVLGEYDASGGSAPGNPRPGGTPPGPPGQELPPWQPT